MNRLIRRFAPIPAALALLFVPGRDARAEAWRWQLTPYLWATDVSVGVEVDDRQVADTTIPVEDLVEDLEAIVQVRAEGQRGPHGVAFDLFHVTLEDEVSGLELPEGAGRADLDSRVGMTLVDVAGLFDPKGDRRGVSILYGTRVLFQHATIDAAFDLATGTSATRRYAMSDTLVDALVGVRFGGTFARRFSYQLQLDASAGDTDHTWSAGPSLTYTFGSSGRYALTAGYRYMKIDFEDEGDLDSEMDLSGILLGFRFSF